MLAWMHGLNDFTGFFLLIIALAVSSIARSVSTLVRDVECLHEDYDRTSHAHERHHWEQQAKMDEAISKRMG